MSNRNKLLVPFFSTAPEPTPPTDVMYVSDNASNALYITDRNTAVTTRVGSAVRFGLSGRTGDFRNGEFPGLLVWDGTTMYMVDHASRAFYSLDRATGVATRIGRSVHFGNNEFMQDATWDGTNVYTVGDTNNTLYRMNTSTGAAVRVGRVSSFGVGEDQPRGLAWAGDTMYMMGARIDALFTIDRTTGAATRVGNATNFGIPFPALNNPSALAWDGRRLYMTAGENLYVLNTTTGVATLIGSIRTDSGSLDPSPQGIEFAPLPMT